MTRNAFNPDIGDRAEFPKLKAQYGEDPARFLQSSKDLAEARIQGIDDLELLKAYRAVAKNILSGSDLEDATEYIDTREHELTGEPITPETDDESTPDPVATDGGQELEREDEPEEEPEPEPEPEPEVQHKHPDASGLDVGQVLVVEVDDAMDCAWPQTPDADEPYILREYGADGTELTERTLSQSDLFARIRDFETEKRSVDDVEKEPPATAALGGDE